MAVPAAVVVVVMVVVVVLLMLVSEHEGCWKPSQQCQYCQQQWREEQLQRGWRAHRQQLQVAAEGGYRRQQKPQQKHAEMKWGVLWGVLAQQKKEEDEG